MVLPLGTLPTDDRGTTDARFRQAHELEFSADGKTLAVAYVHGSVELFDVSTQKQVAFFPVNRDDFYPFWSIPMMAGNSPSQVLWGRRLPSETWKPMKETRLPDHSKAVRDVAFSRDGSMLAAAGGEEVRIWDLAAEKVLATPSKVQPRSLVGGVFTR